VKVLLVGGIYGVAPAERSGRSSTPETTLEHALRSRGIEVETSGHSWELPQTDADVIHVHHLAKGALRQALRVRRRAPLVFTTHGIGAETAVKRAALRVVHQQATAVVALSEYERSVLPVGAQRRTVVIPNGIDDAAWPYVTHYPSAPGEPWRLLFVGQLIALKRVDVLLNAIAQLPASVRVSFDLVFHNAMLEDDLKQLAASLGVADRVNFVGALDRQGLRHAYQAAHLLVLPSETEALPSVVTEAMLSGLPVVASDVGGIPEQLGSDGALVPPGDARALSMAIQRVLGAYPSEAATRATAQRARARFGVDAMVDAHIELYERLVRSRAVRVP
jgi:glycosyltransferase involved in cell wall biosynthesis